MGDNNDDDVIVMENEHDGGDVEDDAPDNGNDEPEIQEETPMGGQGAAGGGKNGKGGIGPVKNVQQRRRRRRDFSFRNTRYNDAYGDYRGGYGPGGGFGPPTGYFGPGPNFFGPPPPPLMSMTMGKGFGPGGPPPPVKRNHWDDPAVKYLLRCGMSKDNVKNLPAPLLDLIEPQYCGLCAVSFDTFDLSRIHYISKNHLKNQKKWLNQGDVAMNRAKEIPLKSRDLYCELCDVHITSKTHSDSHYAGRPHRSIVEGRKNPKNPMLLQRGMENRVEQLIRREKKFLKPLEEEDGEETQVKDGKPPVPELYCDICKTSVTCTEQMTMHLNGKRHLAKEKNHILTMMKGDSGKTGNKKAKLAEEIAEENDEEMAEETTEEKEGEENVEEQKPEEKTDDWENNGEKWEDASIY